MDLTPALEAPPTGERRRLDRERKVLIGSLCRSCGMGAWPARAICHRCGSAEITFDHSLAEEGTLLTFTTVWVPRPGLEPPYVLGQIELDHGVEVFAHVRGLSEEAVTPLPVVLAVGQPGDVPEFWFEPKEVE